MPRQRSSACASTTAGITFYCSAYTDRPGTPSKSRTTMNSCAWRRRNCVGQMAGLTSMAGFAEATSMPAASSGEQREERAHRTDMDGSWPLTSTNTSTDGSSIDGRPTPSPLDRLAQRWQTGKSQSPGSISRLLTQQQQIRQHSGSCETSYINLTITRSTSS